MPRMGDEGQSMPRARYQPEPRERCCLRCFRDPYIRERIREEGTTGNCNWCGATRVKTVHISALSDDFRQAVNQIAVTSRDGDGETLDFLFDDGFRVFSDDLLEGDVSRRRDLLLGILEWGLHPKD